MKPEAQRMAIAEACGWTAYGNTWKSPGESKYARIVDRRGAIELIPDSAILPDYLEDLDAMHEAEKVLHSASLRGRYHLHLCTTGQRTGKCDADNLCHATAAQRAEAFLRTLNLWKPAPPPNPETKEGTGLVPEGE